MDGTTALKYARSRHSTSDFDRSNRQQLIIKAIKNKLFSTDTTTNPAKISEIFSTVMDHLDTDMSLATMAETIFSYRSISENAIKIHTLNNECLSLKQCMTGAYLYSPSRDLFGNASVVIPENARVNKLSYYTDIRRFVDITFRFPEVSSASDDIILVTTKAHLRKAQEIALNLSKLGIKISTRHPIIVSTGTILQSHVNIYWHPDLAIGISPDSVSVEALRYLEESLPYNIVPHNEYVTTDGPKIEIVLGDDIESYFPFITAIYYIPNPTPEIRTVSGNTVSGENRNTSGATQSQRKNNIPIKSTTGTDQSKVKNQSPQTSGKNIQP